MKKGIVVLLVVVIAVLVVLLMVFGGQKANENGAQADPPNAVEVVWWMGTSADAPIDQKKVEEELNKITRDALGVTVKCVYMTNEQMGVAISSGEYFDICFTCAWFNDFSRNVYDGLLLDLKDELTAYPDLRASIPDVLWRAVTFDGAVYGLPVMKDYGVEVYWILDKEVFENELGMTVPETMTFDDIEPYLAAYKEKYPDKYPMIFDKSGITSAENFLCWLSRDALIALDYDAVGTENEKKVYCALEMPEFVRRMRLIHSWYEKGYINRDAAVTQALGRASMGMVQSGQGFYGADAIWSAGIGRACVISRYMGPFLSNDSLQGAILAVSKQSKHPKEAMKILNYVNTNAAYRDMMRYGLENVHYTHNADGTVTRTARGASNYSPWPYTQGSYALSGVEASTFEGISADPNMWQVIWDGYKNAVVTAVPSFTFDYSDVQDEVNAVRAVKEKYWAQLVTGTADPDELIKKMLEEAERAGIRKIMEECQRQLDGDLG